MSGASSTNEMKTSTLDDLNAAGESAFIALLDGVYEHSPWVAAAAFAHKPFASVAALKHAMSEAVRAAGAAAQVALVRAHPELAGKAAIAGALTAESTGEQSKAGLNLCSPEEFATLHKLNADYNARFGFPFIVAVRGPRGTGLTRTQIIEVFTRRLAGHREFELAEALRNIDRIAEIRLDEKFGVSASQGRQVWDWAEQLAVHSDPGFKEAGQ
ncbi:MAG: N-carbamoyl-L-amino-acid hydrolase peptidase, partial [Rhizobacter sp.]|nr:N-carbamoyl-L-amino-acid hydrolase peptidase [Rhizobacter sp.]